MSSIQNGGYSVSGTDASLAEKEGGGGAGGRAGGGRKKKNKSSCLCTAYILKVKGTENKRNKYVFKKILCMHADNNELTIFIDGSARPP